MAQAQIYAKVSSLSGEAYVRNAEGQLRQLKVGDVIREGETVLTKDGAQVVLQLADGRQLTVMPGDVVRLDAEVAAEFKPDATDSAVANTPGVFRGLSEALARGEGLDDLLEEPAAGKFGLSPGKEGHSFIELARIVETLNPLAFEYGTERGQALYPFDGYAARADSPSGDEDTETPDVATITLSSPGAVTEGGKITVTAMVNNPPQTDLIITLNDGSQITIKAGDKTGSVDIDTRQDDVYKQGDEVVKFSIKDTTGGNYEALDISSTTSTTVQDNDTATKITLSSDPFVIEGTQIKVTATIEGNNPPQADLIIVLNTGDEIKIPAGQFSGFVMVDSRQDDVYLQGPEQKAFSIQDATGGNYEALDFLGASASTEVRDNDDPSWVTLSAPPTMAEGKLITVTATVDHAPLDDLVITLNNGLYTITILANETSGSIQVMAHPAADGPMDFEITAVNAHRYELLEIGPAISTTIINVAMPAANPDSFITPEDVVLTGNVLDNDSDPGLVTHFTVAGLVHPADGTPLNLFDPITGASVGTLSMNGNGHFTFTPHENYSGPAPQVTYFTDAGLSSTLEITVTPVAQIPLVEVDLGASSASVVTIDKSNVLQDGLGFTVTGIKPNGDEGKAYVATSSGTGFGVGGKNLVDASGNPVADNAPGAIGNTAASTEEIAYDPNTGKSDILRVSFDDPVVSVLPVVRYLNANESACVTVYLTDGTSFSRIIKGTDDSALTPIPIQAPPGTAITHIEFSAPGPSATRPGEYDDYIVHSITFESMVVVPINSITVTPQDIDFSERVVGIVVKIPDGVVLSAGTNNHDGTWTLPYDVANPNWTSADGKHGYTTDPITYEVRYEGLALWIPPAFSGDVTLEVTATVVDSYDIWDSYASWTWTDDVAHAGAVGLNLGGGGLLIGGHGDDILSAVGSIGNSALIGGHGDDVLIGGSGRDFLVGGPGNDVMTGGVGKGNTFVWNWGDQGTFGAPAVDTITDFDLGQWNNNYSNRTGGDRLDLRDLLQGETYTPGALVGGTGNLTDYLHFENDGTHTTIHISSNGGFAGGFDATKVDQQIILQNALLAGSDEQIIQSLLNNGKLVVDA